jgi:hypothetical protein
LPSRPGNALFGLIDVEPAMRGEREYAFAVGGPSSATSRAPT